MALALMSPNRTVLLIADDALFIYSVTARAARFIDAVAWGADDFVRTVELLLRKECGGKPVLILNDMTDQYFKGGQRLPNVGMMDKQGVLKRKLQVAFPNYPIRGALQIKQKKGERPAPGTDKAASARVAGDLYLFAGVPMAEPLVKTFEAVKASMVAVAGFTLLPVEASDMVRALSVKLAAKERRPSEWAIFIGQHQSGALRQVVTRNGQLAMTRITGVAAPDGDYNAWAMDVYQEFKATLGYLSRYGYGGDDTTDLMVVATPEASDALERLVDVPCHYTSFTANEAARLLGMTIGVQENAGFADALHAAWCGRKSKFILKMDAAELTRIHQPRQAAAAVIFMLLAGTAYLAWDTASGMQSMLAAQSEISEQKRILGQVQAEYDQEVKRLEEMGFDVKLIQAGLNTFQSLETARMDVVTLLKKISDGLGNELRIDKITVNDLAYNQAKQSAVDLTRLRDAAVAAANGQELQSNVETTIHMSFPQTITPEEGRKQIDDLERRLKSILPTSIVWIEKNVGSKDYTETTSGEVGANKSLTAEELDMKAEIRITGPLS
ncbi:MAG TPA: hypothetical protein VGD95_02375 [Micavibrio sp.]